MNKITHKKHGFTIVELLVVIVVIGILAAITVVSYTGITARANKASAQSAAINVARKAEVYSIDGDVGRYPMTMNELTSAAPESTYYLTGVTDAGYLMIEAPESPPTVNYFICGTGPNPEPPTMQGEITESSITGAQVGYWDYVSPNLSDDRKNIGQTSGIRDGKQIGCAIVTPIAML
jgi:prepilin-type N-terminal cleavage/methylation domain-containing protein